MYYILNETNRIIAADNNILELCGVSHIDELSLKIALGDAQFDLSDENITITHENIENTFSMTKRSLSSMLGHLTLVEVQDEKEKAQEDELSILTLDDTAKNIDILDTDSDLISIKSDSEETEIAMDDNELFDLALEDETEEIAEEKEEPLEITTEDTDILDLGLSDTEEKIVEDEIRIGEEVAEDTDILDLGLSDTEDVIVSDTAVVEDTSEILVDIDKVSQQIGVSHEDYDTFLREYIDTALGLEADLQSTDAEKRSNAVATLSHLGEVLQLPVIGEIIAKIDTASDDEQKKTVESFYAALSRITTTSASKAEPDMELFDVKEENEVKPTATLSEKSFGTISLDDVKPIHFDFRLEEAANDLSLPVELIEEFVHDFIEQCHIETPKMLKAYEEGDLDAIQKIGHLLKGASSNLRINALSDTLYKIQFCEDSSDLEKLIRDYWGHFLSFEIQINALAK